MKIVVLMKQILNPIGVVVRRDKERVFVNREAYIIAPGDKNGLESALQIKDVHPETEVAVLSLGPPRVDDALREALAMGADAVYHLRDDAFAEVDLTGLAHVLATAVSRLNPDLIIAGRESGSDAAGQIGPRLAELLDMAQMTDVHQLTVSHDTVLAVRRWGESFASVGAKLPAVVTIAPGVNQPRYAQGARIMNAYREWKVTTWQAADLGLETAVLTPHIAYRSQSFAAPLVVGECLRGEPEDIAAALAIEIFSVQ